MTSRDKTDIEKIGADLPEYLQELAEGDTSLDQLKEHRVLNRLAVIQDQSPREVKALYGAASIAIPASEITVCKGGEDESVSFVPVFFFDEFCLWSDRDDKGSPMIQKRSLDKTSDIARKAQDFDRMREPYGEPDDDGKLPYVRRYVHHLNFCGMIYGDSPLRGTPIVLSYQKGEFKKGSAFISALQMRRAPLWSTVWDLTVGERKNDKGEWYGIDFSNAESPWVDEEDAAAMKSRHEELKEFYKERRLGVGHEVAEAAEVEAEVDESKAPF